MSESEEAPPIVQPSSSGERPIEQVLTVPREFREVPEGFVSVFIQVSRRRLERCAKRGLRIEDNSRNELNHELERIFIEERKRAGKSVDRTQCVFAYPRGPDKIRYPLSFDPKEDILLEAKIDPETAIVANGEYYTEAGFVLGGIGGKSSAREWAKSYWEESKSLRQYFDEGHDGSEDDYGDFTFPEVLIPVDIPVTRLRVVTTQPSGD